MMRELEWGAHLVEQAAKAEADDALGANFVILALNGRHDDVVNDSMKRRVVL